MSLCGKMSYAIDQSLSIYIPSVTDEIMSEKVSEIFHKSNIGKVKEVDFISKPSKHFREAFVHFDNYYDTPEAQHFQYMIETTNVIQVIVDKKKYWLCYKNNSTRPAKEGGRRLKINLTDQAEQPATQEEQVQMVHIDYVRALEQELEKLRGQQQFLIDDIHDSWRINQKLEAELGDAHLVIQQLEKEKEDANWKFLEDRMSSVFLVREEQNMKKDALVDQIEKNVDMEIKQIGKELDDRNEKMKQLFEEMMEEVLQKMNSLNSPELETFLPEFEKKTAFFASQFQRKRDMWKIREENAEILREMLQKQQEVEQEEEDHYPCRLRRQVAATPEELKFNKDVHLFRHTLSREFMDQYFRPVSYEEYEEEQKRFGNLFSFQSYVPEEVQEVLDSEVVAVDFPVQSFIH